MSVVTKETRVTGDIETTGSIRIEGTVTGSVRAARLELAPTGSVAGDLHAVDLESPDQFFVVAGAVRGSVHAGQVEVRAGGSVEGGVVAEHATVGGLVRGGIVARGRLALGATAVVEGDVHASRLALEEGGQVNGNLRIGEHTGPPTEATGRGAPKEEPPEREPTGLPAPQWTPWPPVSISS